jgi:hypothetical protein
MQKDEELIGVARHAGREFAEGDLEVLLAVSAALDPGMIALDRVEVAGLALESDLDPSRAPRLRAEQ